MRATLTDESIENNGSEGIFMTSIRYTTPDTSDAFNMSADEYITRPIIAPEDSNTLLSAAKMQRKSLVTSETAANVKTTKRSLVVDILAIFFGIGTWIGINGTFLQLPLLVKEAPEEWKLPSYLSVMVQIGNLGPIVYTLVQNFSKQKMNDVCVIYGLLAIGTVSSLLTAFLYKSTAVLFGHEHSVALLVLTVLTAINACTSSVLFMPYMGRFKELYLVTFFIGEGLSGLLPSIVTLVQGIGSGAEKAIKNTTASGEEYCTIISEPPRFGSRDYFIFIFVLMLCSCFAFMLLDRLKRVKREYAAVSVVAGNEYIYDRSGDKVASTNDGDQAAQVTNGDLTPVLARFQYNALLLLIGCVSFFSNGLFNSIQSYSCIPYGGKAYHLAATLSIIANPVSCFLALYLPHSQLRSIAVLSCMAAVLTVYVLITAAMSPFPPLVGTTIGYVLVIATWTLLLGLVTYIKLSITTVMRSQGGKSLVWTGCFTQLGATIGSVLIFLLINFTNSFQAATTTDSC